jgi:hypothetical protein
VLPKNYQEVPNQVLVELIKLLDPVTLEGDAFGKVYEFMTNMPPEPQAGSRIRP